MLLSVTSGAVFAQPSKRDKAVSYYEQAEAYFKAEAFDEAAVHYMKAYRLDPRAGLLFNVALAREKQGASQEAIAAYERYLKADPDGARASEANARLVQLRRARDKSLADEAENERHRTRADEHLAGGRPLKAVTELRALHVRTGDPTIHYEIALALTEAGESALAYDELGRYLKTGDATHVADAASMRRAYENRRGSQSQDEPGRRRSLLAPLAATGLGGALLASGAYFGLRARSLESELRRELDASESVAPNDPRFDDGRSDILKANVLFVSSALAVGTAGYLWWRYLKGEEAAPSTHVGVSKSGVVVGGVF